LKEAHLGLVTDEALGVAAATDFGDRERTRVFIIL
jgi:hypothetical protein